MCAVAMYKNTLSISLDAVSPIACLKIIVKKGEQQLFENEDYLHSNYTYIVYYTLTLLKIVI